MTLSLNGKVAVVTGASSGIGWSIAQRLVEEGANVIAFARNADKLGDLARIYPGKIISVAGDVTKTEDLERLVKAAEDHFGGVDVVIPNAGIARVSPSKPRAWMISRNNSASISSARLKLCGISRPTFGPMAPWFSLRPFWPEPPSRD